MLYPAHHVILTLRDSLTPVDTKNTHQPIHSASGCSQTPIISFGNLWVAPARLERPTRGLGIPCGVCRPLSRDPVLPVCVPNSCARYPGWWPSIPPADASCGTKLGPSGPPAIRAVSLWLSNGAAPLTVGVKTALARTWGLGYPTPLPRSRGTGRGAGIAGRRTAGFFAVPLGCREALQEYSTSGIQSTGHRWKSSTISCRRSAIRR
jgi:hypothetical protein